jgi:hypothetical protein
MIRRVVQWGAERPDKAGLSSYPARHRHPQDARRGRCNVAIKKDLVLGYFDRCAGHIGGRLLHNAARYLMRLILQEHEFADMDDLIAFCADPDNLRAWLPTETDRMIFSEGLVEGLRDIADGSGLHTPGDARVAYACPA